MKIRLAQVRLFFFCLFLIFVSGFFGYKFGRGEWASPLQKTPPAEVNFSDSKNLDFSLFWDIWQRLEKSYLNKKALDPQNMYWGAIKGMVGSLGDPYTVFLPPSDNKQAKEDLSGEFEGVGIQLGYKDSQLAVIAPLKGTPAWAAGVKAGDLILKIEDKETTGITLPEAVKLIRGPKGTKVKLTLLHEGEKEPYEAVIVRDKITVPSVELEFVDNVAHLKLTRFGDKTGDEWEKAVGEILAKNGLGGVILDLRDNPGGYLSGAIFIASEFLDKGVVVQQEGASGVKETFSVNRQGKLTKVKLVVLVNEGSASASEIVAGALQDYGRAKIVGVKTFGKGTIQEAQELEGGAGLHITTARWLLPKGRSIDKEGIKPDVEVKDDPKTEVDEQLEKALKLVQLN
jgi:carboxyl-terminal processing protease